MNTYAKTYKEYKSGKYSEVLGLGRLYCYWSLDHLEKSEREDIKKSFISITWWINCLEEENKRLKKINRTG